MLRLQAIQNIGHFLLLGALLLHILTSKHVMGGLCPSIFLISKYFYFLFINIPLIFPNLQQHVLIPKWQKVIFHFRVLLRHLVHGLVTPKPPCTQVSCPAWHLYLMLHLDNDFWSQAFALNGFNKNCCCLHSAWTVNIICKKKSFQKFSKTDRVWTLSTNFFKIYYTETLWMFF